MKKFIFILLFSLSCCTTNSKIASSYVQDVNYVVKKTDYDKIENQKKEKTEARRRKYYHKLGSTKQKTEHSEEKDDKKDNFNFY